MPGSRIRYAGVLETVDKLIPVLCTHHLRVLHMEFDAYPRNQYGKTRRRLVKAIADKLGAALAERANQGGMVRCVYSGCRFAGCVG